MAIVTGSQPDFVNRLKAVLPNGWFPAPPGLGEATSSPVLDAFLTGPANILAAVWQLLTYALRQTRIKTATGMFLDTASVDFFGQGGLSRQINETDTAYRARILAALFPLKVTRPAISGVVQELTGVAPLIIEPRNASDTKGYGSLASPAIGGGYGYDTPGTYYGTMLAPFQGFLFPDITTSTSTQAQVMAGAAAILPEATVVWVAFPSPAITTDQ